MSTNGADSTRNVADLLRANARERPDAEALVDLADGRRWTHAELERDVAALVAGLASRGVQAGDVVAILALNSAPYVQALLALSALGAIAAPLNVRLQSDELAYNLGLADPKLVIADAELVERLGDERREVLPVRGERDSVEGLIAAHRGARPEVRPVRDEDPQRILFTSGTTSRPKGVTLTHGNVRCNFGTQIRELELTADDRLLICLPLFHVAGSDGPGLAVLAAGGALVVSPSADGRTVCRAVDAERITGSILAASTAEALAEAAETGATKAADLRFLVFGGLPASIFHRIHAALPHVRLVEAMGMTETTSGIFYVERERMVEKRHTVGRPVAEVEIRIVDDQGADVPRGELGELIVRGPKVTPGYWRDEEATAAAIRDGWLHSGDMVTMDDDGYVTIVDRKKDMIRSGGENVASAEVERVLLEHPAVAEVGVVGAPDERWGEVPHAVVVLRSQVSEQELREHCLARLAKFKVPARIHFVRELPRTASGKVRKPVLREWVKEGVPE